MTHVHDLPGAEVAAYGAALRGVRPSERLDARIANAIANLGGAPGARARARQTNLWRWGPAIAAGCAAILTAAAILWVGQAAQRAGVAEAPPRAAAEEFSADAGMQGQHPGMGVTGGLAVVPTGQYSLWPTDAAVFRVRTSIDTLRAVNAALPGAGERQFWIDVRVANDGSMRIVRIVPVDEASYSVEASQ